MSRTLDRELAAALEAGARHANEPGNDFYTAVIAGARQRRRSRRLASTVAASGLVFALVATIATVSALRDASPAPGSIVPPASAGQLPDFAAAKPPEQVWPQAIRRLPMSTPDGHKYLVEKVLPADEYLISWYSGTSWMLGVLNPQAHSLRPITAPGQLPPGSGFQALGMTHQRVVWSSRTANTPGVDVWASPLDGGDRVRIAHLPPATGGTLIATLVGDHVIWGTVSIDGAAGSGSLYQVSVSGGATETIPNSTGYLLSWFQPELANTLLPWADNPPMSGKVWDLRTGEDRTWTRDPRVAFLSCGMSWCGGVSDSGRAAVQRRDGSGYVELPRDGAVNPLTGGRFAFVLFDKPHDLVPNARENAGNAIWDLKTGQVSSLVPADLIVSVDGRSETTTLRSHGIVDLFVAWEQGDQVLLLDLNRIP